VVAKHGARRLWTIVIVAASLLVAGGLVWYGLAGQFSGSVFDSDTFGGANPAFGALTGSVLTDMNDRQVLITPAPDVANANVSPIKGRFMMPAHDLDVPLYLMSAHDGLVNPPTLTDAFVLRGSRAVTPLGTTPLIVTMHAVRGGTAPGNAFFDAATGTDAVRVAVGDLLYVAGETYSITAVVIMTQADAAASSSIWGMFPDGEQRLVVITCVQRPGARGRATENLVLYAQRA